MKLFLVFSFCGYNGLFLARRRWLFSLRSVHSARGIHSIPLWVCAKEEEGGRSLPLLKKRTLFPASALHCESGEKREDPNESPPCQGVEPKSPIFYYFFTQLQTINTPRIAWFFFGFSHKSCWIPYHGSNLPPFFHVSQSLSQVKPLYNSAEKTATHEKKKTPSYNPSSPVGVGGWVDWRGHPSLSPSRVIWTLSSHRPRVEKSRLGTLLSLKTLQTLQKRFDLNLSLSLAFCSFPMRGKNCDSPEPKFRSMA